jgi:L-lactate dehydrogenase (cytochrome)
VKPSEVRSLIQPRRPPAPHGVRRLARCYSIDDLRRVARRRLPAAALAYLEGGGEDEYTLRRNRDGFDEVELVPRVLCDVARIDTTTELFGATLPAPIVLAPVGAPRLFHHEGELAVARAAGRAGLPYAISTVSTFSIEQVAAEASGPLWFQLYLWSDRDAARELISRARAAGYTTLLVTVDTAVRSKRERELRAGVTLPSPTLSARSVLEGAIHPSWWWKFLTSDVITFPNLVTPRAAGTLGGTDELGSGLGTLCWDDLGWIREAWPGPVVLKGIFSVDDARRAVDVGMDGVVVSNHGGRQLDHVAATIDALPRIVDVVGDQLTVLLDSGIRRGTDVVTALALGARAVLVGRAHLYGLAAGGEGGVAHALDILTEELRLALALTGCTRIDEVDATLVRRR